MSRRNPDRDLPLNPAASFDPNVRMRPATRPEFYSHKNFESTTLGLAISETILGLNEGMVPKNWVDSLIDALPVYRQRKSEPKPPSSTGQSHDYQEDQDDYSITFNLRSELTAQMMMVRGMRKEAFNANGTKKDGVPFADAKYVIQANDSMMKTMMKNHSELLNIERFQKIEIAVHRALDVLPPEYQQTFTEELTRILSTEEEEGMVRG